MKNTLNVDIRNLKLDPLNPRLPSDIERGNEEDILQYMAEAASVVELIQTIGSVGYFEAEPLICVEDEDNDGKYIVVEGNRRLSALKLLNRSNLDGFSKKIKDAVGGASIDVASVPICVYPARDDILDYLGNKHIAGVKAWGSLAKARYIDQLIARESSDIGSEQKAKNVARKIGSRSDFIRRTQRAFKVYQFAEDQNFFGLSGVDEHRVKFALLPTALGYKEIASYLYNDVDVSDDELIINAENCKDIFSWMFELGSDGATKLGESRNLSQLNAVIASDEGLRTFKNGSSLKEAYFLSDGRNDEFDTKLSEITSLVRLLNSFAAEVDWSEARQTGIDNLFKQSKSLKLSFEVKDDKT